MQRVNSVLNGCRHLTWWNSQPSHPKAGNWGSWCSRALPSSQQTTNSNTPTPSRGHPAFALSPYLYCPEGPALMIPWTYPACHVALFTCHTQQSSFSLSEEGWGNPEKKAEEIQRDTKYNLSRFAYEETAIRQRILNSGCRVNLSILYLAGI